jgi:Fe2+ or Zn2+ uptake regulation protein
MPDPDELVELLRRRGLRPTPQRRAVIDAVRQAGGHVTAESVYERVRAEMPAISLKTVYETLHSLVAVGELQELVAGPGPTRFDAIVEPHHHLICLSCHRIEDADFAVAAIAADQRQGFTVARTEVVAWGHCPDCQGAGAPSGATEP